MKLLTIFLAFFIFCGVCHAENVDTDKLYKNIKLSPQDIVITIPKDSFVYFKNISAETHSHTTYEIKVDENTFIDVSITPYDGANFTDKEFATLEYGDFMTTLDNTRLKHTCKDDICRYRITAIMLSIWYTYPKDKSKEAEHFINSIRQYDESIVLSEPDKIYNPTLQARLFFDFNQYTIDEKYHQYIKNMCDLLNDDPKVKLRIRSSSTTDEHKDIGQNRIDEVIKMFAQCGIDQSRVNIADMSTYEIHPDYDDLAIKTMRRINLGLYRSP